MELLQSLELIGPGRWFEQPMMDQWLQMNPAEQDQLRHHAHNCHDHLSTLLQFINPGHDDAALEEPERLPGDPSACVALWLGKTAILLQQWAGHRVDWFSHVPGQSAGRVRAQYEFEDLITGQMASEFALSLVSQALTGVVNPGDPKACAQRFAEFRAAAGKRIFPLDASMLMAAAKARDIPVCKLDREPYEPIVGEFRLRDNGLLRFGDGCYQQIVDGTLCLQRSAKALQQFRQAGAALDFLRQQRLPVARNSSEIPPGEAYRFLCAGQQLLAVIDAAGLEVTEQCGISWLEAAAAVTQKIETGMLVLTAQISDLASDLRSGQGAFTHLDISPRLDEFLQPGAELYRLMADDFVSWMFPGGRQSRLPLFSVTGTNGKTTICRMLRRIAQQAGFRVGMACTDGVYLNDQFIAAGDYAGREGHHLVLESKEINLAVLETARGAVLSSGFMFDHSDVAICSNVSPEHLGEYDISTARQMSEIKQLILQRARTAAVLNFDDPLCREIGLNLAVNSAMKLQSQRICWTSCLTGADQLETQIRVADRILFLEEQLGISWIVSRERGVSTPLMPVGEIPASFGGKAMHNVSNALQAIAAALEMGISWQAINTAMAGFSMNIDDTPGRLNVHIGPGFPVLLDFVQNIDGMRVLCEFVRAQAISGKRILVMSVLGRHDNATVAEFARLAAQNFDYFICRNYAKTYAHRSKEEIPALLREGLLAAGVAEQQIAIVLDEPPALNLALEMGRPGDIVVMLCGARPGDTWQQISDFASRRA